MVHVGEKYKEKMPSWVGNGNEVFSWEYTVAEIVERDYGTAARCICTYESGHQDEVFIDVYLFDDETFYKKVA